MNTTTELNAVNSILATIGETPVSSLQGETTSDANLARTSLSEVSLQVQGRGWHWNTEYDVPLPRNAENEIEIGNEILHVDFSEDFEGIPTLRGRRVYNRKMRTYTWSKDLVARRTLVFLTFEELSETARRYIAIRAGRLFQARFMGSALLHQLTELDEQRAWAALLDDDISEQNVNLLEHPTVAAIIHARG